MEKNPQILKKYENKKRESERNNIKKLIKRNKKEKQKYFQ